MELTVSWTNQKQTELLCPPQSSTPFLGNPPIWKLLKLDCLKYSPLTSQAVRFAKAPLAGLVGTCSGSLCHIICVFYPLLLIWGLEESEKG